MDDDRSWLKNPVLPRPAALPRFSAAELDLVNEGEEERTSSVMRVARKDSTPLLESSRYARVSGTARCAEARRPGRAVAARPRRIA